MSSHSYTITGYGFPISSVKGLDVINFVKNHAASICTLYEDDGEKLLDFLNSNDFSYLSNKNLESSDSDVLTELFNNIDIDIDDAHGKDIISNIIKLETDIDVQYESGQEDCCGEECIILQSSMPWQYNYTEKMLTEDKLHHILADYADALGVNSSEISYMEIEYYG